MRYPPVTCLSWPTALTMTVLAIWSVSVVDCHELKRNRLQDTLDQVYAGIIKAESFFGADYSDLNVDGIYGIRFCQGSLIQVLKDCTQKEFHCPQDLKDKIKAVNAKYEEICIKALPYNQERSPSYLAKYTRLISSPFAVENVPEQIEESEQFGTIIEYNDKLMDICFTSLLGTYVSNERVVPRCTVSDICWQFITWPNAAGYYITHQLLYFIIGEQFGCHKELQEITLRESGKTVREIQKSYCEQIYAEADFEEIDGNVDVFTQDLFIEQILLCGSLGFSKFFNEDWIRMVLSWQTPSGCYKSVEKEKFLSRPESSTQANTAITNDTDGGNIRRKLLTESLMSGDCLSHKTGLAVGLMGQYMKYLVHELYIL